jgi:Outer membrane protein beta-barrel domain
MKKIFLSISLALGIATTAQAQVEIGLKISPSLGFSRSSGVRTTDDAGLTTKTELTSDGARLHFGGGLVIDYFFGENYAFNTGVELLGKGGTVKGTTTITGLGAASKSFDLGMQYVQVPLALKLFTNEIAPDTRLYFLVGGQLAALVGGTIDGKKNTDDGRKATKSFNTFDAGVQTGLGAEMQLGKSTKVFGGLTYQHGLLDVLDKSFAGLGSDDFTTKNSLVSLDLGLKF